MPHAQLLLARMPSSGRPRRCRQPARTQPPSTYSATPGHAGQSRLTMPYQIMAPKGGARPNRALSISRPLACGSSSRAWSGRAYCADVRRGGPKCGKRQLALIPRHIRRNEPASFRWMPHDIDHAVAYFAHRVASLLAPNFSAGNGEIGHGHAAVFLAKPVAATPQQGESQCIPIAGSSGGVIKPAPCRIPRLEAPRRLSLARAARATNDQGWVAHRLALCDGVARVR
jgi:hypothetical protein